MKILGIDPALSITGYGVVDFTKRQLFLLEAGVIKTSARQPLGERLNKINQGISSLISETRPDVAVVEKIYAHYVHPAEWHGSFR